MAKDKAKAEKTSFAESEQKSEKKSEKKKGKAEVSDGKKSQGAVAKWFKDLKMELKKVVWPKKDAVINNSIVVFATMLGFALFTFLLDQGFLWLFQFAISSKG